MLTWRAYFYPRPPRGGRREVVRRGIDLVEFLSTPSARRATKTIGDGRPSLGISIHALREEGDAVQFVNLENLKLFLSTPSARRATTGAATSCHSGQFLSTPSARRATGTDGRIGMYVEISIHALREEGDQAGTVLGASGPISIHALREEGDVSLEPLDTSV